MRRATQKIEEKITILLMSSFYLFQEHGHQSEVLRVVSVPIISNAVCHNFFPNFVINENNICAGLRQGGKDACQVNNLLKPNLFDLLS